MALPNPVTLMRLFPAKHLIGLSFSIGILAACQAGIAPVDPPNAKVSPQVTAAAEALVRGAATPAHTDAQGRLQVYVYVTDLTSSTLVKLSQAGLADPQSSPEMGLVQGWIAPRDLDTLTLLTCVKAVTLPRYALPR